MFGSIWGRLARSAGAALSRSQGWQMIRKLALQIAVVLLAAASISMRAQPADETDRVVITKIDPPNWWTNLPKPFLLLEGRHLDGARFSISDEHLSIERTNVSANGHWAELWLNASPASARTVEINADRNGTHTAVPFTFAQRHDPQDGFAGFSSKDVMYLIMTDRFADGDTSNDDSADEQAKPRGWHGGDLRGITEHLDYLQQLGITTVWITPVYQNKGPESYHGYGATNMYAVDKHFGSLEDLKTLAASLHRRGMKLVLDMVPNHVGPTHPWVDDSPEPDWFHGTKANHAAAQGEFKPLIDPHSAWRDRQDITQGWFADILPDLNQENPVVAQYLAQNAVWWTEETGLDGIRLDTFPYVGRQFWHAFHQELHSLYPRLTTVGEVFNPDPAVTSAFAGGAIRTGLDLNIDTGLDTPFDFPSYFALRDVFLNDAPMTRLADVLRLDGLYPHPERLVPFLGNHDTTRFMSQPGATLPRLNLAFTVLATMRGMPQIYSGEEIAMKGGEDPDNRRDFPGGFAGSPFNAFSSSGRTPEQQQTFTALEDLLAIRRVHPALETGDEQVLHVDNDVLIFARTLLTTEHAQHILVVVNKGRTSQSVTMSTDGTALAGLQSAKLLRGDCESLSVSAHTIKVHLAAETAAILEMH
jgi:neopullulanase